MAYLNLTENNLATSPTQLSLKKLKDEGYLVAITEHWNPFARIRQDMFGFCDIMAIRDKEILFVQTTSATNANARIKKIANCEHVGIIRKAGIMIHVHGWHKNKSNRWECKVRDVS
jgi:hypothetical protein